MIWDELSNFDDSFDLEVIRQEEFDKTPRDRTAIILPAYLEPYFRACKPPNQFIVENAVNLWDQTVRVLEMHYGIVIISSGYRSREKNDAVGGATLSLHMTANAVDISDPDGHLKDWILQNTHLFPENVCFEHFAYTDGWVHLQVIPVPSGNKFFIPYAGPVPESRWNDSIREINKASRI